MTERRADVVVTVLDAAAAVALERREPPGRRYARWAAAAQDRGELTVLVAWAGTEPVGSGEVTAGDEPELRNLRVDLDHRGRGVGSALIAAAERLAAACGVLRIGVALDNPDARRLYERAGYVATGEVQEYDYTYVDDDGRQVTAQEASAYLAKNLRGGA
ncbi:GNAT family N-acetyltransferase [Curtobacterium sp. 'Ferrero']|uniref:GNAT family N-acetyltransferase n=1 Tax=Curtobacterium sp. 'Ferrero' TaxID=2033654 RepID=UPI000BD7F9CC|nr:GNAT family N-acetyltransferase [Curtobacterium sp. 'Ferrero']PCN49687.1 GNAT family N-acetyltransferase [Curtobacterium sp. 'Ferrero']